MEAVVKLTLFLYDDGMLSAVFRITGPLQSRVRGIYPLRWIPIRKGQ